MTLTQCRVLGARRNDHEDEGGFSGAKGDGMRSGTCKQCGCTYTYDDYGPFIQCGCSKRRQAMTTKTKAEDVSGGT